MSENEQDGTDANERVEKRTETETLTVITPPTIILILKMAKFLRKRKLRILIIMWQ